MAITRRSALRAKMKFPWLPRALPLAASAVLILLVFLALQTYRRSSETLARQHNLQHLRLIETVAVSLENQLMNVRAACNHYATLIDPPFGPDSSATKVCDELEKDLSTVVSSALILGGRKEQDLRVEELTRLALTPESTIRLEHAAARPEPGLLLLRSVRGESLVVFLTPLSDASAHFGVVISLDRLLSTYHLNDTGYDGDYAWILDREGTLLYHRHYPEMVGNSIHDRDRKCL